MNTSLYFQLLAHKQYRSCCNNVKEQLSIYDIIKSRKYRSERYSRRESDQNEEDEMRMNEAKHSFWKDVRMTFLKHRQQVAVLHRPNTRSQFLFRGGKVDLNVMQN